MVLCHRQVVVGGEMVMVQEIMVVMVDDLVVMGELL